MEQKKQKARAAAAGKHITGKPKAKNKTSGQSSGVAITQIEREE